MSRSSRPARSGLALLLAALGAGSCAPGEQADGPAPVAGRAEAPPVCLEGEPFVADGALPLAGSRAVAGDARRVAALRWSRHPGCERLVVDLAAESGEPALRAGVLEAELLRHQGVLRLSLPEVTAVEPHTTEATFAGPLATAAYAFFSEPPRRLQIDLHLGEPALAHVSALELPARVVVDLRPGGGTLPEPAAAGRQIVVLEPRPGAASYPLVISGYTRQFEANVVARLEQQGEEVALTFGTAAGWLESWGAFTLTLEEGPTGPVVLHVGDHSARDGTWEGVAIELEMR